MTRRELALDKLADAIAHAAPGARVLVIGNPFAQRPGRSAGLRDAEEAALRGVKQGLGTSAQLIGVAHPDLKQGALENPSSIPIPPGATTPLSFMSAPGAWDRIRQEHLEANVWVSLIGLPADLSSTAAWTDSQGVKWALLLPDLRLVGSLEAIRDAFAQGRILAAVLNRPGAPPESQPLEKDRQREFDRRFLLLTRDNLDDVMHRWPQVLQ